MATNKKITDLQAVTPQDDFNFVVATDDSNFRITFQDLSESILPDNVILRPELYQALDSLTTQINQSAKVTVSVSPPSSPSDDDFWWDSVNGKLKIYYSDGDTKQWVDATPQTAFIRSLNDIGDVDFPIGTISNKHIVKYDGVQWTNDFEDPSASVGNAQPTSARTGDLWYKTPAPGNGDPQLFVFDGRTAPGEWKLSMPASNFQYLNDLLNVSVPNPSNGDILSYNGSTWINVSTDLEGFNTGDRSYVKFSKDVTLSGPSIAEGEALKDASGDTITDLMITLYKSNGYDSVFLEFNGVGIGETNPFNIVSVTFQRRINLGSWENVSRGFFPGTGGTLHPITLTCLDKDHGAGNEQRIDYRIINNTNANGYTSNVLVQHFNLCGDTFVAREVN